MGMRKCVIVVALSLLSLLALPAFADKCKDPIVDEVSALSEEDRSSITAAANKLVLRGADVRVQVLSSYHNTHSVDEYKAMFQAKCKSWQSPDGGFKNNAIVVVVVPKKRATGLYYGEQWRRQLEPGQSSVLTDMNGRFRDGKIGEGIVVGLNDFDGLLSVRVQDAGKPVVIDNSVDNRKPIDFSGLWTFLKWMFALGVFGGLGWFVFHVFGEREKRRAAQSDAKAEKARCTQAVNGYTTPLAVLRAKVAKVAASDWRDKLGELTNDVERTYSKATSEFRAADRGVNNPDTPNLSVKEYEAMGVRYANVLALFGSADRLMNDVERQLERALSGAPLNVTKQAAPPSEDRMRGVAADQEPVPSSPVFGRQANPSPVQGARPGQSIPPQVSGSGQAHQSQSRHHDDRHDHYHQGDTTVVVVNTETAPPPSHPQGDPWTRQRQAEPDYPVIVEPSQGGGVSSDWGKTSQGGGVSSDWGETGSGGRTSGVWDEPAPVSRDEPTSSSWDGGRGTGY